MNISIEDKHKSPNSSEIPLKQNLDCTWTPSESALVLIETVKIYFAFWKM